MLFAMAHLGLLLMPALDRIPSQHGRFQLITLWQRLIMVARRLEHILRYQLSRPSGLAPQSPTSFRFRRFHPYPPLMVQLHRHLPILLSRTPSEGNFRHFQTQAIRGLGSVLKAPGSPLQMDHIQQLLLGHTQQPTMRIGCRMYKLPRRLRSRPRSHLPWLMPKSWVDMAMHLVVMKLKRV